nr:MAG: major capsid protein [Microviridae sp.]
MKNNNSIRKTLGGDRLGSGKKLSIELHNYERSTHDLGYIFRTSQAPGTLVPFMSMVALPGDTFDIVLNADVKTLPTIGPMFGSFKLQLDVFKIPIRLYNAQLHNNKLGVGMNMSTIKLPMLKQTTADLNIAGEVPYDLQQVSPSSLLAYLGIRGIGKNSSNGTPFSRDFNAVPFLGYWDIYKNYYANKQEENGQYIHYTVDPVNEWLSCLVQYATGDPYNYINAGEIRMGILMDMVYMYWTGTKGAFYTADGELNMYKFDTNDVSSINFVDLWSSIELDSSNADYDILRMTGFIGATWVGQNIIQVYWLNQFEPTSEIQISSFSLSDIDVMRDQILGHTSTTPFEITASIGTQPYQNILGQAVNQYPKSQYGQEGLALKTYQSDLFNNWLQTDWIDGENGISAITAVSTAGGYFNIDTLNLSKKVYDMLNRVAVSGGSYNDWMQAVYGTMPYNLAETPTYCGGLSKEIVFQEVVSLAGNPAINEPLGTLGGKGVMSRKHKGGMINIKIEEPSYIMGIVSITPRIDYSQGNQWDVNLQTMDDFHKPALDEIGFQELIEEQMAFWTTHIEGGFAPIYQSAGKQPAWLNYMTNYNKTYGDFADVRKEMYMTLNRRYEVDTNSNIADLTTYIDPSKFNYMFAYTKVDAQNFWVQIAVDIEARRKMSAKLMPNL